MQNNEQQKKNGHVDLPYFLFTTLFVVSLASLAIYDFNKQNLVNLSMPVNGDGVPCSKFKGSPYLNIKGPNIYERQCGITCQGQVYLQLGAICIPEVVQYILKQNNQYYEYIEPKINNLKRFQIIGHSLLYCLSACVLIMIFSQMSIANCLGQCFRNSIIGVSILTAVPTIYFLYNQINLYFWILLVIFSSFYLLYIISWRIFRVNTSMSRLIDEKNLQKFGATRLSRLTLILIFCFFTLGLFLLIVFQYLCFVGNSPYYTWKFPDLFYQVTQINYKQALLYVETLYLLSFTLTLYQYMVGYISVNNLGIGAATYHLLSQYIGSLCKLSIFRLVFCIPIFILTFIKPIQTEQCTNICHCMFGYFLNKARKYSLPSLAFQSTVTQNITISEAMDKLYFEIHENKYEFSQGYIQNIATMIIISNIAILSVLFEENKLNLSTNIITMVIAVISGLWLGLYFASGWIFSRQGYQVRNICQRSKRSIKNNNLIGLYSN